MTDQAFLTLGREALERSEAAGANEQETREIRTALGGMITLSERLLERLDRLEHHHHHHDHGESTS